MKKLTTSILLFLSMLSISNAQSVNFIDASFVELQAKAKAENKFLFIDCMTDWCYWCKVMDKETFTNSEVAAMMNNKFVAAQIDMEKGYGINLAMKYRITGFPTFLIFDSNGKLVYTGVGYQKPPLFMSSLKASMNPATQMKCTGISDIVDLEFPAFYKNVFGDKKERKSPTKETVDEFLSSQKNLKTEISFSVMFRFANLVSPKYSSYYLENLESYRNLYGEQADGMVDKLVSAKVQSSIKNKSDAEFNEAIEMINKYVKENKEATIESNSLHYYFKTENYKVFSEKFQTYLDRTKYGEPDMINSYCWDIYEKVDNNSLINNACKWMDICTKSNPEYAYLDTYAALLFKNKKYDDAERVANLAIETGKSKKDDVAGTEELLVKIKEANKK